MGDPDVRKRYDVAGVRPPSFSEVFRIVRAFGDWPRFLGDYAGLSSPARSYKLRTGRVIETHGVDRNDVATLFAIFGRQEYGRLPDDAVVLDVGANIGGFALYAAQRGAHVYSFEPEPSNYRLLLRNVPPSVKTFEVAVTDRVGRRRLYIRSSPSHSLHERRAAKGSAMVDCVPLGTAIAQCELDEVDLLKLDVEGSEFEILYGAPEALSAVNEIRMEYHHFMGARAPWRIAELRTYLAGLGFSNTLLHPTGRTSGIAWFRRT
jgi:FkbM family methyltransferase